MFTTNPFAALSDSVPSLVMQVYIVLMTLAVIVGTLADVHHKGSAKFFARRRQKSEAAAQRRLGGGESVSLAIATLAEAAVSGEFCKWPRRLSHLLMMYGFLLYVVATVVMVFAYPGVARIPAILPALWTIGGLMVLVGGLWFFFFLRVDVAYDGASPFHLGRADLFVGSLLASVAFALVWNYVQTAYANPIAMWTVFGLYVFFTTLLFVPAVAFQRRVEEANGSSDLPSPAVENHIVRS